MRLTPPRCPMCEKRVVKMVYESHCARPHIASVIYIHPDDERHFVVAEPKTGGELQRLTREEKLSPS